MPSPTTGWSPCRCRPARRSPDPPPWCRWSTTGTSWPPPAPRPTAAGWPGSPGIIRPCPGTGRSSGRHAWRRPGTTSACTTGDGWPVGARRSASPGGGGTAASCSWTTGPDGGCPTACPRTVWTVPAWRPSPWWTWRRSSTRRTGSSASRPWPSGPTGPWCAGCTGTGGTRSSTSGRTPRPGPARGVPLVDGGHRPAVRGHRRSGHRHRPVPGPRSRRPRRTALRAGLHDRRGPGGLRDPLVRRGPGPHGLGGSGRSGGRGRRRRGPAVHRLHPGRTRARPVLRPGGCAPRCPDRPTAPGALLPRWPHLGGGGRPRPGRPVLRQPGPGGGGGELPGEQRLRPGLPAAAGGTVGPGRRRRLRALRLGPGAGRSGRRRSDGHPGHQRRRPDRPRGTDPVRPVRRGGHVVRGDRSGGPGRRHPRLRVPLPGLAGRPLARGAPRPTGPAPRSTRRPG